MLNNHSAETIWFLLGALLMITELATPGFILFFFGLGAWFTALLIVTGLTNSFAAQLIVFLASSLLFLIFLRRYGKAWFKGRVLQKGETAAVTGDVQGEKVLVVEAIEPATLRGKVELHGTRWNADADEPIEKGATVLIVSRSDLTLKVRRLPA